jgi:biopolymer transport protein TolR
MGMGGGGGGGAVSEINVTPLIDVLLVLLIIFMVIVPVTPRGLNTLIPQPPKNKDETPDPHTIVVSILSNGKGTPSYKINEDVFNKQDLEPKLLEIFSSRADKVMFVKGDDDLDFSKVAEVIDYGHAAGVDSIGLITPKVAAGE